MKHLHDARAHTHTRAQLTYLPLSVRHLGFVPSQCSVRFSCLGVEELVTSAAYLPSSPTTDERLGAGLGSAAVTQIASSASERTGPENKISGDIFLELCGREFMNASAARGTGIEVNTSNKN